MLWRIWIILFIFSIITFVEVYSAAVATHLTFWVPISTICVGEGGVEGALREGIINDKINIILEKKWSINFHSTSFTYANFHWAPICVQVYKYSCYVMVGSPKGCIHIHITTVVAADRSWTGKERRAISQTYKPFQDIHTIYTRSCHPIDRGMSRLQLLL